MDWNEYQKLAFTTNAKLGASKLDKIHMILGMSTEIGEMQDVFKKNLAYGKPMDWQNIKEEVGDALWYAAGMAEHNGYFIGTHHFSAELVNSYGGDNYAILIELSMAVGELSMNAFGGDSWRVEQALQGFVNLLFIFCVKNDIDFWRIAENNIEKLMERYPKKFNSHDAIHRDLEAEANILDE